MALKECALSFENAGALASGHKEMSAGLILASYERLFSPLKRS